MMNKISKLALASVLAVFTNAAMAADTASANISITGTGVASCGITAPASVSLGNIISGRSQPLLTPVSVSVDCTVPWSLASSTNGVLNIGANANALDLVAVGASNSSLGNGVTVAGDGATAHSTLNFNLAAFKSAGVFNGPVGTGAVTGSVSLTLTY